MTNGKLPEVIIDPDDLAKRMFALLANIHTMLPLLIESVEELKTSIDELNENIDVIKKIKNIFTR